jgi:hypothetical protein
VNSLVDEIAKSVDEHEVINSASRTAYRTKHNKQWKPTGVTPRGGCHVSSARTASAGAGKTW